MTVNLIGQLEGNISIWPARYCLCLERRGSYNIINCSSLGRAIRGNIPFLTLVSSLPLVGPIQSILNGIFPYIALPVMYLYGSA